MGMSGRAKVPAIGVGLLGLGVVGSAVARAVVSRHGSKECAIPLDLIAAVVRDPDKKRTIDLDQLILSDDPQAVIGNTNVAIVVELMGGENPAFDYISSSLKAGKHVVTANKEVMCKRGDELLRIAADNNVELKYEARKFNDVIRRLQELIEKKPKKDLRARTQQLLGNFGPIESEAAHKRKKWRTMT